MGAGHEVGARRTRREDGELITGQARYTDDLSPADVAHAAIVRSPLAHASIEDVDASAAEAMDGVLGVYTAADVEASDAPGFVHVEGFLDDQLDTEMPMLAGDVVRYAGEPVAAVVAENRYTAHDAVEAVDVDYERRDAVVTFEDALADDAPVLHEQHDDNRCLDWQVGDREATDEAFAAADRVVELEIGNQRVLPDAMEPRAALAAYDPDDGRYTVRFSTQAPHRWRSKFATMLGVEESDVHVDAPAVGGGFGSKGGAPYSEEPLTLWLAKRVGRPVKWVASRTESHRSDHHGRDVSSRMALAVDDDGTMRGLRVEGDFNIGAYLVWGSTPAKNYRTLATSQYDIPVADAHFRAAFTNTSAVAPYRGAGRPEAIYSIERLVDEAAAELGLDPVELRRRNQIPGDAFPFETAFGTVYDSGAYEDTMDVALEAAGYEEWRERQADLREEGRYLGIGVSCFTENTGTGPGMTETGKVSLTASGTVDAYCGTFDHGQGHRTTFAQLLADELGVAYEDVAVHEGDTDDLPSGTGTFGSRSAAVGGSALVEAAREVIEKARNVAAHRFEADPADVEFGDGAFRLRGAPDRSLTVGEVAELAADPDLPDGVDADLEATAVYDPASYAFAFGTHVVVAEVDPASGEIDVERYVAVDDCGTQFNPRVVEGQVHGGVAQGLGQALYEHAVYEDNGTLTTGSLQDYALPKSFQVPSMTVDETETPCPHNPTGAKGAGEGGTIASTPAVVNAVADALRPFDPESLEMPLDAETVWRAVGD